MRLLVDTHLLIWSMSEPSRLPRKAFHLLGDDRNELYFSVISLWEIGVKRALKRPDFLFDPHVLRAELLVDGYTELPISGEHALAVERLPPLHRDSFDRLLICQALVEGLTLLTNDDLVAQYPVDALLV